MTVVGPAVPGGAGRLAVVALLLGLTGCALSPARQAQVEQRIEREQERMLDCATPAACAAESPFHRLFAQDQGNPRVLMLEGGADALRLRLHLIRSARRSIDLQTYVFSNDASSHLLLDELLAAARRGVRVRVLADQLFSLGDPRHLAGLALAHRNLQLRLFNPTFGHARTPGWKFAAGIVCCFSRFNQRMHNKLLLIDGTAAIIGGRNYRDSYFDLDPDRAYYDRELLVLGPAVADMRDSFDLFWQHRRSVPASALHDVGRALLAEAVAPPQEATAPDRQRLLARISAQADDLALVQERFIAPLLDVQALRFVADAPDKVGGRDPDANAVSEAIADLLASARREVILQTPYLVIGRASRAMFRDARANNPDLVVRVSTNSLAATDAFPVYGLSYKYKKRYLRELGFRIREMRPDPGALADFVELGGPVQTPRVSLHAKSALIDGRISLVGTHNFDPRSEIFNTESAVIIDDPVFADRLATSLHLAMAPANSWVIAPRERGPAPFHQLSRLIERVSTALPLFDLWPFRYARSFEVESDCLGLRPGAADFHDCHRDVGDFPGEPSLFKRLMTRLAAAFGAPLVPIL